MTRAFRWLTGYARLEIRGGSPHWCLNRLAADGIAFWDIEWIDALTVFVTVYTKDEKRAARAAQRSMCTARTAASTGFRVRYAGLQRRLPLLIVVALSVLLSIVLPRFIWFYSVEGNDTVPTEKIVRAARDAGLRLGMYGPEIDPQTVKNRVLEKLPELSWLTVTQNGACAVIEVRERTLQKAPFDRRRPSDLLAVRDGLVTEIGVLEGSAAVRPGEIVQKGQVLIRGRTDLEQAVRYSAALGEVYARTWRDFTVRTPSFRACRAEATASATVVSLQFGKKRIKISRGSGIFPPECDKMTVTRQLTLPNGHTLPVALRIERGVWRETRTEEVPERESSNLSSAAARRLALRDTIAGEILREDLRFSRGAGGDTLHAVIECREMLAGKRQPIRIEGESTNDGTRGQR